MSRIVLAVALLFLGAEAAHADDDFKTCASGPPDYAIMACTNLIEVGKLAIRDQAIAYTNRGVAFRNRGDSTARSPISIAPSSSPRIRRRSTPIAVLSISSRTSPRARLPISTVPSNSTPTMLSFYSIAERSMPA